LNLKKDLGNVKLIVSLKSPFEGWIYKENSQNPFKGGINE